MARGWATIWVGLLALGGCARPGDPAPCCERVTLSEPEPYEPHAPSRSALFGGDGLDPLATVVGRSHWPAAFRDEFAGEVGAYHEFFYDVQRTPLWFYWGNNSYTRREFRSDRTGAFRR